MIVGLLKNKFQVSIFTLIIVSLVLFAYSFCIPSAINETYNTSNTLLYHLIFRNIYAFPLLNVLFNMILILSGAFLVSFLCIQNEIVKKDNYLPAFFYLIFSISAITSNQLQPILISNLILILCLFFLFNTYRNDNGLSDLFAVGVLLTLASSFYTFYIFTIAIGFVGLLILKSFNWREWFSFIIGLSTPIYIYMCISYLGEGSIRKPIDIVNNSFNNAHLPIISEYYLTLIIITFLLLSLALFSYLNKGFGAKVKTQKSKFILIWLGVICLCSSLFDTSSNFFILPCLLPFSIILGDYLGEIKQIKIANTLLLLIIVGFGIICLHNLNFI